MTKMYKISGAAKELGVSIQTLRRWAKESTLVPDYISPGGHRFYSSSALERFSAILVSNARAWVSADHATALASDVYCENSSIFLTRLNRFSLELQKIGSLRENSSLIDAIVGEIGNNSFDHNLGNWPDVPGVFFGYDLERRYVVLADRGQGVLRTLKKVRPKLASEQQALLVAFTESISGRAPEKRGNGLKFVRTIVTEQPFDLFYQSGDAVLEINPDNKKINPKTSVDIIHGTLAVLHF